MGFSGEVLSVEAMLARSLAEPEQVPPPKVGLLHSASGNAAHCARLLSEGESLESCWRFGVLQTLDDYTSSFRRGGVELGAQVFQEEVTPTGALELDAAFAALADHLSSRDGWPTPAWALDPTRVADGWFPAVPRIFRDAARKESPRAFRDRGIFITARSLERA
ncbi:MAG: hypothetical protein Q4D96_04180 [Propionibacteriaceae bacterium]|nr:hypothetical protein [Propionibacteriaceae bacterium]